MKTISHSILCRASAQEVYQVICDTEKWPELFEACVKAEVLETRKNHQLVRITAREHQKEMTWDTYRTFLPDINGIDFYLPIPMPLLKKMEGRWRVLQINNDSSLLVVERSFEIKNQVAGIIDGVTNSEEALDFMMGFIERNSGKEMLAIKNLVESIALQDDELSYSFDSSRVLPFSVEDIYTVLADAANWSNLLPHCQEVNMLYDDGKNQEFVMKIGTKYGNECVRSIRRCNEDIKTIEYFQPAPPPVMTKHCGSWMLSNVSNGTKISARHEFQLNPQVCFEIFGEGNHEFYKKQLHDALEKNSLTTLESCEHYLSQKES